MQQLNNFKKLQSGFTLIEIAIVLVIIGLLLGGVLKGQEMINNSKTRNTISGMDGIAAAVYSYQDRYKALPGDDPNALGRWGGIVLDGDGNGVIDGAYTATDGTGGVESALIWEHLRQAGLITGAPAAAVTAIDHPTHAFGGTFGMETVGGTGALGATGITAGTIICITNLEDKFGEILDRNLDDGDAQAGDFQTDAGAAYDVAGGAVNNACRRI